MKSWSPLALLVLSFPCFAQGEVLFRDLFEGDGLATNSATGGGVVSVSNSGAEWTDDGEAIFLAGGAEASRRALLYSEQVFQSEDGLRLTVNYTTGSVGTIGAHQFSFGLVSSETNLASYVGDNPFGTELSLYSFGVNLTAGNDVAAQGLNFTDGGTRTTLDQAGNHAQFAAGEATKVELEIGKGGYWCYRINDVYEASGVLLDGFDLGKSYHVAVFGQDGEGGGKSVQSIKLEKGYAAGERAAELKGNWNGGQGDLEKVKHFKTLDSMGVRFTDGAVLSAQHDVPHKLLEFISTEWVDPSGSTLPIEHTVAPTWGDLSLDEPAEDLFRDKVLAMRAAGFRVQAYTNSENFLGSNTAELQLFVDRWKAYCDQNPEVQAFIASQPYHTGVWNRTTGQYEIAYEDDGSESYPDRKYMFCYAEFILKDYALRYGEYLSSWIFDDGSTMSQNGDSQTSGRMEEQRIYQAFANAVHAGNPDLPIAFQNGRSNVNYNSTPYAHAVRFEDFTFGHAFGGNNNHAEKINGNQYTNNYRHITRMTATDGYVHEGGAWTWDDLIVGNFHSKLSTSSWKYGPVQAWEEEDFFRWNLEAMQAGGRMTWAGSIRRNDPNLQPYALTLLQGLDEHLAEFENPGSPNWARAYTLLAEATDGVAYHHLLREDRDFWDPEGDDIEAVWVSGDAPAWLSVASDSSNPGDWVLGGLPDEEGETTYRFEINARDQNGEVGTRTIELVVQENATPLVDELGDGVPIWASDPLVLPAATDFENYSQFLTRGIDFADFDGDSLTMQLLDGPSWVSLTEYAPHIWQLSGTPLGVEDALNTVSLSLSDGSQTVTGNLEIEVVDLQFPAMQTRSIKGNASWGEQTSDLGASYLGYNNSGRNFDHRALFYSEEAHQSDGGFRLTVNYTVGNIGDVLGHNFSFGLIQADEDLENYAGFNPFGAETSVYSLGVNLTSKQGVEARGLNFTNGTARKTLDQSGTHVEFVTEQSTPVVIEIREGGVWQYSIAGITEAMGTIPEGFDLSKAYRIVLYGQDDHGGGKTVESITLDYLAATEPQGYEAWSLNALGQTGAKEEDGDFDGISNLLEYVLGGDPQVADPDVQPHFAGTVYRFNRRKESVNDSEQWFQYSVDLVNWTEIALSESSAPEVTIEELDGEMEEVEVSINPAWEVNGRIFSRLKVR